MKNTVEFHWKCFWTKTKYCSRASHTGNYFNFIENAHTRIYLNDDDQQHQHSHTGVSLMNCQYTLAIFSECWTNEEREGEREWASIWIWKLARSKVMSVCKSFTSSFSDFSQRTIYKTMCFIRRGEVGDWRYANNDLYLYVCDKRGGCCMLFECCWCQINGVTFKKTLTY